MRSGSSLEISPTLFIIAATLRRPECRTSLEGSQRSLSTRIGAEILKEGGTRNANIAIDLKDDILRKN